MSDIMFFGVLSMPYEMAMGDELSRRQFYDRAQEAVTRLKAAESAASRPSAQGGERVKADPALRYPGPWRVGLFWSSSNPEQKVRCLAESAEQIAEYEKRVDFIQWIAPVAVDADRLIFMAHSPSRYVEQHPTNSMWRVYQDMAPATAVAANWVAMTPDYHNTPREAIDAAIRAGRKG